MPPLSVILSDVKNASLNKFLKRMKYLKILTPFLLSILFANLAQAQTKKLNPAEEQIFRAEAVEVIKRYYETLPKVISSNLDSLVLNKIDQDDDEAEKIPYRQYFVEQYFDNNDIYVYNDLSPDDQTERQERRVMTIDQYLNEMKRLYDQGGTQPLEMRLKTGITEEIGYNHQAQEPFFYAKVKVKRTLKGSYLGKYYTENTKDIDFYVKTLDKPDTRLKKFTIIGIDYKSKQVKLDGMSTDEVMAKGLRLFDEMDYETAFKYLNARKGEKDFRKNSNATFALAYMYFWGRGTERNEKEMLEWLEASADRGNMYALFNLGENYFYGEYGDVEADEDKAIKLIKKSARKGYVEAQFFLGERFEEGKYIRKSISAAKRWYRRAAKQGHIKSDFAYKRLSK